MQIPIVDFTECGLLKKNDGDIDTAAIRESGRQLYEAFSTSGFVYLSGSGISRSVVDQVNEVAGSFFSQSLDFKTKFCSKKLGVMCYDPLGSMNLNPKRPFDHQEGFRVAQSDECEWPDVPHFKERITDFKKTCRQLLLRILKALGAGMRLKDPNLFANSHRFLNENGNTTVVKLLYYPPVFEETNLEENQMRIAEHSDFGSITLLFHDEIGGLQVQTPGGEFIDAPYIPGTILLNVGDMMQFWTGGKLKSTIHRVVFPNDPGKRLLPRRSITYFGTVDDDVLLDELEFDGPDQQPPKNSSEVITAGEYTRRRFEAAYAY